MQYLFSSFQVTQSWTGAYDRLIAKTAPIFCPIQNSLHSRSNLTRFFHVSGMSMQSFALLLRFKEPGLREGKVIHVASEWNSLTGLPVCPWLRLSLFISDYRPAFFIRKSPPKKANCQGCYGKCIENKKTRARDGLWGGVGSYLFVTSLPNGMDLLSRIFHWSGTKGF